MAGIVLGTHASGVQNSETKDPHASGRAKTKKQEEHARGVRTENHANRISKRTIY
jgi:hypothetical protein